MDPAGFRADLALVPESLERLAATLDGGLPEIPTASRTLVLGMGSSRYAAGPVALAARAAGHDTWVELASAVLLPAPAGDLIVIAVSATGTSAEVLSAARRYSGQGRLVAVTNTPESELAQLSDVVVDMGAGIEAGRVACRTYRHTIAVLLSLLAPTVVPDLGETCRKAALASSYLLENSDDWLGPVSEALASRHGTFTLAPVERLGSALQSALMLREGPRRLASACETGDWPHVDVYLTKTLDYRALVFAGSTWDEPALAWLRERGTTYVGVGADLPGAAVTVRFPHDDDPWVSLLTEVMVGELLAHRWW
ncbi:MAG: iron dicitrate transport regulator FecR [Candidatus Nanopelagicales bacterium]